MHKRKRKEGVRKRQDSPYWWTSYTNSSGKRVEKSTGTTSKREALKVRAKWVADDWNRSVRGIQFDATIEQVVLAYLDGTKQTKRSSITDESRFKSILQFYPEGMVMNTFTHDDVRGYIQHRVEREITNQSINKELSVLSSAIKWCNSNTDLELPNPIGGKRLPEEEKEARCLSVDEFQKLLNAAKATELGHNQNKHTRQYLPEFLILGFTTMMRPSEMLKLEWNRVNFAERTVELRVQDTKGKQRRLVPLNDDAVAALTRLQRICDKNFADTPWVFTHTKPRYFGERVKSVARAFQAAVDRSEIGHATPHSLRHTSITEGVHVDGANVVDISKVAGHKNLQTTMKYVHTAGERLQDVVANLPTIATL
tara:strand:+ start:514 stop:1617 length:1104 start_codon:yes stop_codon:yes gene_type:complete